MSSESREPVDQIQIDALHEVRRVLLTLHKALLDHERIRYEQVRGRFQSPGELLQLVLNDPWFAWLRPLSRLIVQIDSYLEEEVETTPEALFAEVNHLLSLEDQESEFYREYQRALQESPEVVMAHGAWKRMAPKKKKP